MMFGFLEKSNHYRISRNSNRSWIITAPVIVTAGQFLTKKMIIVTSVLLRLLLREIWYIYPIFGENLTNKVIGTAATITGNTVVGLRGRFYSINRKSP